MMAKKENILFQWISWQFWETPREILKAWKNFLLFNLNYFSIVLLLKTFFSPWRKYSYSYGRGFDLGRYFEAFTFNLISRVLGAMMRVFLIVFGFLTEIFIIFAGMVLFLGWLILPVLLIAGLISGFSILIQYGF